MFSILDMFKIGVGPSSSHTVGPMIAASNFVESLEKRDLLGRISRVKSILYGSLSMTGLGHGTDRATMAGLEGNVPATVDTDHLLEIRTECESTGNSSLAAGTLSPLITARMSSSKNGRCWQHTRTACVSRLLMIRAKK